MHRSDASGTTYIFSSYLSAVSPAWAAKAGTGRSLHWPAGYAADGNPGVAGDFSIVNQPGRAACPICGYSWVLVYAHQPSQVTGQALVSLLTRLTTAGQSYAASLGYVPLPPGIRDLAAALFRVTSPGGAGLAS